MKKKIEWRLGKKDKCPYDFSSYKDWQEEYKRWEKIAKNNPPVLDKNGKQLYE